MSLPRTVWIQRALAALLLTASGAHVAEASVAGSHFFGGFVTNLQTRAVCTLTFTVDGQVTEREQGVLFGGTYTGPYSEFGAGAITYWRAVLADGSPNGTGTISGYCLFGLLTTFHIQNFDQGITADGLLIRTGPAAPPAARPAQRRPASGPVPVPQNASGP